MVCFHENDGPFSQRELCVVVEERRHEKLRQLGIFFGFYVLPLVRGVGVSYLLDSVSHEPMEAFCIVLYVAS